MAINQDPSVFQMVICANIFIRKDSKYLLLKRSPHKKYAPNFVHPFGGKLDPDENPFEAAVREVKEEVGIDVKNIKLEAVINEIKPVKDRPENWLIFHFSADYAKGEIISTEEGEAIFLTKEEVLQQNLFPSVRHVIDEILDEGQGTVFTTVSYDELNEGKDILEKKHLAVK